MSDAAAPTIGAPRTRIGRVLRRRALLPTLIWTGITFLLLVLQHVSNRMLRAPGDTWHWQGLHYYLDGWEQFDGHEYVKIAEHGYWYTPGVRSPVVWFPLYPSVLRGAMSIISDPLIAGILVSGIGGVVAVNLYWRWLAGRGITGSPQVVALLALMLYPYGWYLYAVVHSDSMFLAFTVGAFILLEADRKVLAGIVGALATATRPTGMALIPALVILSLERDGVLVVPDTAKGLIDRFRIPIGLRLGRLTWRSAAPLLAVGGIGAYMLYLGVRFGDPMAFANNQKVYHPGRLPLLKREFFGAWMTSKDWTLPLTLTGQAIVTGVTFLSVPFVGRRFGWGYAVFVGVLACIPTFSTEDFMGSGRYLIAAFPTIALLGERLAEHRRARVVVLVVCGLLMTGMSMGFARSWYLT